MSPLLFLSGDSTLCNPVNHDACIALTSQLFSWRPALNSSSFDRSGCGDPLIRLSPIAATCVPVNVRLMR